MKSDNKGWLFWGFIVLVILNVILLIYIFAMNKPNVGLAPSDCIGGTFSNGVCTIGDSVDPSIVNVGGSAIAGGANQLNINIDPTKQRLNLLSIKAVVNGTVIPTYVMLTGTLNTTVLRTNIFDVDAMTTRLLTVNSLANNNLTSTYVCADGYGRLYSSFMPCRN